MKRFFFLFISLLQVSLFSQNTSLVQTANGLQSFYSICAVDSLTAWVAGERNYIVRRTYPGLWTEVFQGLEGSSYFTAVHARSSTLAWAAGINYQTGKMSIYKTTDGINWVNKYTFLGGGTSIFVNYIYFWNNNEGVAIGDPVNYPADSRFLLLRTTNGGETWSDLTASMPSVANICGLTNNFDVVGNDIYFGTSSSVSDTLVNYPLLYSTDKGVTWNVITMPAYFGDFYIGASSPGVMVAASIVNKKLAYTTNYGASWEVMYPGVAVTQPGFVKGTGTFYANTFPEFTRFTNFGRNRTNLTNITGSGLSIPTSYVFRPVTENTVWAMSAYGIFRSTNAGSLTGMPGSGTPATVPDNSSLWQNYPNPFNPVTTFKYNVKESGTVRFSIFNINGEEVRVLFNEYQTQGTHLATWNGMDNNENPLPSGTYFYQIIQNGQSEAKKMILLK